MRITALISSLLLLGLFGCEPETDEEQPTDEVEQTEQEQAQQDDESDHHGDDDDHELADDIAPGETHHYGAEFTIEGDPMALIEAIEELDNSDKEELELVKVNANVEHVCEKRGCWFSIDSDEVDIPIRVTMKDYAFFVPRNGAGSEAVLEGTLARVTLSEEEARHYAEHVVEQTGVDPEDIEGEEDNYAFVVTGISMTSPES